MSGLSQCQHVFRITKRDAASNGTRSSLTKRNRSSVSCLPCRERKLRCDRQVPCISCSTRREEASCTYSNPRKAERGRRDSSYGDSEAQLRLQKLEEMVTSLIQANKEKPANHSDNTSFHNGTGNQAFHHPSTSNSPIISESFSRENQDLKASEKAYVNATHWTTVLENIRDIRDVLEHDSDHGEDIASSSDPDIVVGTTQPLTLVDVCTTLPPRSTVDKLLSVYFNTMHSQTPILHAGKFLREYESFWTEPTSISFLWISMLFSTLYISSRNEQASGKEISRSLRAIFFQRAGQALLTGNYMRAKPYSVESMLLYGVCKYIQKDEHDTDAWMTMGISTRLAMRMGYHRDPRNLANVSPFEGEMRRRTFCILEAFDLLLSFQAGLPAIIHEEECDTDQPGNLLDTDFDEDCKVVPPSRPPTDSTPMLYYRHKSRLARIFRRIYQHAISFQTSSYEKTMQLDAELDRAHKDVPPSLRLKPLALSFTDQPYMILNRLYSDLVYLKSVCVLHRQYLSQNRSDPTYDYSRRVCGDAALQILKHQAELNDACQPGGLFHDHAWMLSSLSCHDFLLAAMITCLDLYESHKQAATSHPQILDAQVEKHDALRHSYGIWMSRKGFSRDARRASSVLAIMLSKVPRPNISSIQRTSGLTHAPMNGQTSFEALASHPDNLLFNVNEDYLFDQTVSVDSHNPTDSSNSDPLNTVFSEFDNIDWGLIDQALVDLNGDVGISLDSQSLNGPQVPYEA